MVQFARDGIPYKTKEGEFFIPKALIFYELEDYTFPSTFYFIAKLGNKIELRRCRGGKDVKWFQIPNLHEAVSDLNVILKIEKSINDLKKQIESSTTIKSKAEDIKQVSEIKVAANRLPLTDSQKAGYVTLVQCCLPLNSDKINVLKFISSLKNYDGDQDYFTTLNFVMEYFDENELHCIMSLDWKAEIEDLNWRIISALKENYHLTIDLLKHDDYDKSASVSDDNVFSEFDEQLRKSRFQLGFIETESDEYVLLVHKIKDKQNIEKAVKNIGYTYFEK